MAERLGYGLQIRLQRFNSASHLHFLHLKMIVFWGSILGLPCLAFGGVLLFSPSLASKLFGAFRSSRAAAAVLATSAWFWTAYELDIIGIEAFDRFTKMFPGELWILAAVLSYLVCAWMPKNLPVRALSGILMLVPAELFKTTRLYRPESGVAFAAADVIVAAAYLGAIAGMYGMFYPWRIEKAFDIVVSRNAAARIAGAALAAAGAAVFAISLSLA